MRGLLKSVDWKQKRHNWFSFPSNIFLSGHTKAKNSTTKPPTVQHLCEDVTCDRRPAEEMEGELRRGRKSFPKAYKSSSSLPPFIWWDSWDIKSGQQEAAASFYDFSLEKKLLDARSCAGLHLQLQANKHFQTIKTNWHGQLASLWFFILILYVYIYIF